MSVNHAFGTHNFDFHQIKYIWLKAWIIFSIIFIIRTYLSGLSFILFVFTYWWMRAPLTGKQTWKTWKMFLLCQLLNVCLFYVFKLRQLQTFLPRTFRNKYDVFYLDTLFSLLTPCCLFFNHFKFLMSCLYPLPFLTIFPESSSKKTVFSSCISLTVSLLYAEETADLVTNKQAGLSLLAGQKRKLTF